jgi:hypothetical protein
MSDSNTTMNTTVAASAPAAPACECKTAANNPAPAPADTQQASRPLSAKASRRQVRKQH